MTVEEKEELTVSTADQEAFLAQGRKRHRLCAENEAVQRRLMVGDLRFDDGEQWIEANRTQRELENRPCMVFNRTRKFATQVANKIRQTRPGVEVGPVDQLGDPKTAAVFQDVIRYIERNSDASGAYGLAADNAVRCGLGYFKLTTEYLDDDTFDQEIRVEPILNQFAVYYDPYIKTLDGSDATFAFHIDDIPRLEFLERFPGSELHGAEEFASIGDAYGWISNNTVRVAEYWYTKTKKRTLCQMSDGKAFFLNVIPQEMRHLIVRKRPVLQRSVHWAIINGTEVLDQGDWPGRWIPIIPVYGEMRFIDGERRLSGLIRHVVDAQRSYNYLKSAESELIALAPRIPYIAEETQIANHVTEWQESNIRTQAVLLYTAKDTVSGQPLPPPQRQVYEPPVQAIAVAAAASAQDMKEILGIYEPTLGALSGERSGKAIRLLQEQGDTSTYHFTDNLRRAVSFAARQYIDLIPKVYDRPGRLLRIIGQNGKARVISIGKPQPDEPLPEGIEGVYDLQAGRYDVTADMGPMVATASQEANDTLTTLAQANPAMVPAASDLIVETMRDFPGKQKLQNRLRKMVPPELRDEEEQQQEQQIPPEAQQQLQQMTQQIEQLSQALDQQTKFVESKEMELTSRERIERMNIESRERLEAARLDMELVRLEAQASSKEDLALLKEHMATVRQELARIARDESGLLKQPGPELAQAPASQPVA